MTEFNHVSGAVSNSNHSEPGLGQKNSFVGRAPTKGWVYFLGFVCAIFWGVGTQFIETPWIASYWYVGYGVSIGELLFFAALPLLLLTDKVWQSHFGAALYQMKYFALCLYMLSTILLMSVVVNMHIYGGELIDAMVCLRLVYFLLVAIFVHAYVNQYGLLSILFPFVLGLSFIALDQLHYAFSSPEAVILPGGLPMVRAPNVAGAVFGYGVLFSSLALLNGGRKIYWLAASLFAVASAFTFSKGAWIMVSLGCVAFIAAMNIRKKVTGRSKKINRFVLFVVALTLPFFIYEKIDALESVITFKMETTKDNASVDDRFNLALVGLYAMVEHPLLGVGYRNYDVVGNRYPDLIIQNSGNANNAFLQIGAVGGVMSFALIVWLFVYPFKLLYRILTLNTWVGKIYFWTAFLVMFIFAVVQIQLIAQPVFWVFIGLISGWQSILKGNRTASLYRIA